MNIIFVEFDLKPNFYYYCIRSVGFSRRNSINNVVSFSHWCETFGEPNHR